MTEILYEMIATALLRSLLVTGIGLLLLFVLRNRSGATRHMVCVATLAVLFALPVISLIPQQKDIVVPSVKNFISQSPIRKAPTIENFAAIPISGPAVRRGGPTLSIGQLLALIYLAGFTLLALRYIGSLNTTRRIVRGSEIVPSDVPYPVRLSRSISVPLVTWWGRYTIVLPEGASDWPETRLCASIQHEVSHVRRGDLAFSFLANMAKLVYWPNPLVWVLNVKLTESAEQATDDCVLESGVNANDYASILVQTAADRQSRSHEFALSMARTSKMGRRVRAILDPLRNRGAAQPLVVACCGVLLLTFSIAMGRMGSRAQDLAKVAIPDAYYQDIRQGLTVPADKSNDFTAVDASGRKIQLVQIQRWTPSGIEAWKPDGTRLASSEVIKDGWQRHDPTELHLYTRFKKDAAIDLSGAGISSGQPNAGDPPTMGFLGGWAQRSTIKSDMQTVVSLLGVPKLGTSGMTSVSFGFNESAGDPICTLYPNDKSRNHAAIPPDLASDFIPNFLDAVHESYPAYGMPFVFNPKGEALKDKKGDYVHKKVLSTEITYTEKTDQSGNHSVEPVAYRAGSLAKIPQDWNSGHQRNELYDFSYFWPAAPKEIDHIDIVLHKAFHVAYLNFHLRPNGVGPR